MASLRSRSRRFALVAASCLATTIVAPPALSQIGPGPADATIDAAMRSRVLDSLERRLADDYVFPDAAAKMVDALKTHAVNHDYDGIGLALNFANRITTDLQAASHDRHLRVLFGSAPVPTGPPSAEERERRQRAAQQAGRSVNYGFESVARLAGNVGYLDLRGFLDPRDAGDAANAAMAFLANSEALIIDLRKNGGGTPLMTELIISYLYPQGARVALTGIRNRAGDVRESHTLPSVPGRTLAGKDVYVLTSSRTFSAAEAFSYDIQSLKRGTIVGEVTGGGANPGGVVPLAGNFAAFIPTGSAYNPITKTNWEGVGVKPDVQVSADDALNVAHLLALRKLVSRDGPPRWKQEVKTTLDQLEHEVGAKTPASPTK